MLYLLHPVRLVLQAMQGTHLLAGVLHIREPMRDKDGRDARNIPSVCFFHVLYMYPSLIS